MKLKLVLLGSLAAVAGCSAETGTNDGGVTDSIGTQVSPLSASIIQGNREVERQWNLLARVEVQPDELLEFYEPHPGVIWVSTAGAPEAPLLIGREAEASAEPERSKPEVLWNAATDRPMPASLVEGIARSYERLARGLAEQAAEGSAPPLAPEAQSKQSAPQREADALDGVPRYDSSSGLDGGSGSGDWCDDEWWSYGHSGYGALSWCPNEGGYWTACWDHVTGSGSAWHDEVYALYTNVCPYRGNITFKVSADESFMKQGSWTVAEDTYRGVRGWDDYCDMHPFDDCVYVKAAVSNASGDGYNYRFVVYE